MYDDLRAKLAAGQTIVIDGGTGTEIQARGVPMHSDLWCSEANVTHPDEVAAVHASYIAAGAELVIANTFATSPFLLHTAGRIDEADALDRAGIAIALRVRDGTDRSVAVAGSMSVMELVSQGRDRAGVFADVPETWARDQLARKAERLAAGGVDLIAMEMMRDTDHSVWATAAACATGLPVWVGIATRRHTDGTLGGYGREDVPLGDIVAALATQPIAAISIMHSPIDVVEEAIATVRQHWSGPLGVYPELGYFEMPDWRFTELSDAQFVDHCRSWHALGARILGGCCGIRPPAIAALAVVGLP